MWEGNSFIFSETFLLTSPKNEVSERPVCNPWMSLLSFEITFLHLHVTYLSSFCSMGVGNMLPCMSLQLGDQSVMVLCTFGLLPEAFNVRIVKPIFLLVHLSYCVSLRWHNTMDMSILVETIKIEQLMCNHNMCQIPIKLGDSLKIHGLHSCLLSEGVMIIVLQNWSSIWSNWFLFLFPL